MQQLSPTQGPSSCPLQHLLQRTTVSIIPPPQGDARDDGRWGGRKSPVQLLYLITLSNLPSDSDWCITNLIIYRIVVSCHLLDTSGAGFFQVQGVVQFYWDAEITLLKLCKFVWLCSQGNKCVFNLCRACCKKRAFRETADCPGKCSTATVRWKVPHCTLIT